MIFILFGRFCNWAVTLIKMDQGFNQILIYLLHREKKETQKQLVMNFNSVLKCTPKCYENFQFLKSYNISVGSRR